MTMHSFLTRRQLIIGATCSTILLPLTAHDVMAGLGWRFERRSEPVQLPPLGFEDERGQRKSLLDFRGRVILLSLWASWCGPCVRELPYLDQLRSDMSNGWFQLVPVAVRSGDAREVRSFYETKEIRGLPVYTDQPGVCGTGIGERGVPMSVLIDPAGCELGRFRGAVNWASDEARGILRGAIEAAGGQGAVQKPVNGAT